MEIQKFASAHEMVHWLKSLKSADHFKIAKSVGIHPKDKAEAHLYADYIVQGTNKGLTGPSLVQYAETNVARLANLMPYLRGDSQPVQRVVRNAPSVAKPTKPAKAKLVVSQVGNTKVGSVVKTAKPAKVKTAKVKHPDFTIVHRADRGGYEGWYGGKAEAFRDTVEKVQTFFQKKYQQTGKLV